MKTGNVFAADTGADPTEVGRVVLASPSLNNSTHFAVGVSVVPSGSATTSHTHDAEEGALILSGRGRIVIAGKEIPVAGGDFVSTPPNAEHSTVNDGDEPMLVFWVYAPPGAESRWMTQAAVASNDDRP